MKVNLKNKRWQEVVDEFVGSLQFGVVQVTIHQGQVVQIEKTEKHRFDSKEVGTSKE